jgi:NAD(P)-dependent dehydrogenase (short-subunit alcohol dehydrogenase family)
MGGSRGVARTRSELVIEAQPDEAQTRVVAISGAGTGIGQVTAMQFAELGWHVVAGGRRVERLAETKEMVEKAGGTCLAHELDVTEPDSIDRFFGAAEAEFGTVTAVINNAATARYGPLENFSPAEIQLEVSTKLVGSLLMARRAIQQMRSTCSPGDILFVTSVAAVLSWPWHLPYAAAGAGVEHAARTLRAELEGSGIRVSLLRCGETAGTDFGAAERESGRMLPANQLWFRRGLLRHTGLLTPDVVARAIVAAVTLPAGAQYEIVVQPTAPAGAVPESYEEWTSAMMHAYFPG